MEEGCLVARSVTTATTFGSFSHSGARPVAARQTSIFGTRLAAEPLDDDDVTRAKTVFPF